MSMITFWLGFYHPENLVTRGVSRGIRDQNRDDQMETDSETAADEKSDPGTTSRDHPDCVCLSLTVTGDPLSSSILAQGQDGHRVTTSTSYFEVDKALLTGDCLPIIFPNPTMVPMLALETVSEGPTLAVPSKGGAAVFTAVSIEIDKIAL
ncbi:hypothetical protein BDN72DRAFT_858088 [Pluteus cervinus]|uniref:Uncharacterized protein n=1 Tax=Pluteus cervinus TaxID=181527 RepID=A0ACD3ATD1_9AGAR|nr:hypothetical protein BDN72DRAFT_858088 [Pluteus cervinus]